MTGAGVWRRCMMIMYAYAYAYVYMYERTEFLLTDAFRYKFGQPFCDIFIVAERALQTWHMRIEIKLLIIGGIGI